MNGRPNPCLAHHLGVVIAGLGLVAALAGCVADFKVQPRPTPTIGVTSAAPAATVSLDEALVTATAANRRGDAAAVVRALEPLGSRERVIAIQKLMTATDAQDFAQAERLAQALPAGSLQTAAVGTLARARFDHDAEGALRWALALASPPIESKARLVVAESWVEHDPKAALERLRALPASAARTEMLGYAAAAWARRDAKAATAWLRDQSASDEKDHLATSMGFALAQSEPAQAVELLNTLPDGRDRRVLVGAIGQTWVARDADQAWRWAQQLPEGAMREAALAGIETGLGGAGSRVARSDSSSGLRPRTGAGSVTSPDALPLGVERDDVLRRKFDEALRESPVSAASYLTSLPTPDRRDTMVDELVRRWAPLNPDATKTWIDQNIPNPARREQLLRDAGVFGY